MDLAAERAVYDALRSVFSEGAYSTQILNRVLKNRVPDEKSYITKLFYGVLDKSIQFDAIIAKVVDKKPQRSIIVLIKIGLYLLRYTDTPAYAAVHKTVELAKLVGKSGASGFINAVLKKSQSYTLPLPNDLYGLSLVASYPQWVVKKMVQDYGFEFARELLLHQLATGTHIRVNQNKISITDFEQKYPDITSNRSKYGYYVTHTLLNSMKIDDFFIQSLSSMYAVERYLLGISPNSILDMCAAPGGKSVYIKELLPSAELVACDLHAHRVDLMRRYAYKAGADILTVQHDATVFRSDFSNRFDLVICDVPCSGIGVASKKPEILWNRSEGDIAVLSKLQLNILNTASKYVQQGGRLCYSTCTLFRDENERVCEQFLSKNTGFQIEGTFLNLFPHTDGCDGFFVASFEKL